MDIQYVLYKKEPIDTEFSTCKSKKSKNKKVNTTTITTTTTNSNFNINNSNVQDHQERQQLQSQQQNHNKQEKKSEIELLKIEFEDQFSVEIIENIYNQTQKDYELARLALQDMIFPNNNYQNDIVVNPNNGDEYKLTKEQFGKTESSSYMKNSALKNSKVEEEEDYDLNQPYDFENMMEILNTIYEEARQNSTLSQNDLDEITTIYEESLMDLCLDYEQENNSLGLFKMTPEYDEQILDVDEDFKELQVFIENQILQEAKNSRFKTNVSDFPTLTSVNIADPQENRYEYFLRKANIKRPPDKKNEWDGNHTLHKTAKLGSAKEIFHLGKLFPNIPLTYIKEIYCNLSENYEATLKFLMQKHGELYQKPIIKMTKKKLEKSITKSKPNNNNNHHNAYKDADIAQILATMTYEEIRKEMISLSNFKKIIQRAASTARKVKHYAQAENIEYIAKDRLSLYNKYSKASKHYALNQSRKKNELYQMDLHGLFLDEAKDVILKQIQYIQDNIIDPLDNTFKFESVQKDGKYYIKYNLITGKGNNSKTGESILLHELPKWLREKKYYCQENCFYGHIVLFIPI